VYEAAKDSEGCTAVLRVLGAGEPPRDKVETSWVIPATGPALNRGAHGRTYPPRGNAEIFGAYLVSSDFEVLA
jgi:hypothetical protein